MEDPRDIPCPPHLAMPQSTLNQQVSSSFCSAQRSRQGLHIPNPQSQSFSPSFRSSLPTSLTYLNPVGQRLLTLEAWCSYGYDQGCECSFPSVFQGQPGAHQKPQRTRLFPHNSTPPPSNEISGKGVVNKKRQRSLRPPICITKLIDVTNECPRPGYGLLALFPFKQRGQACM